MIYEYSSFLKPYISLFLMQKEKIVCTFTYAHFCGILQHFDNYVVKQNYSDCNFTEAQVFQWMRTIKGKSRTIRSYIANLNSFFHFLEGYGFHPFRPSAPKICYDYMAYDFSDEEIDLMIMIADNYTLYMQPNSPDHPHSRRKYRYVPFELPMFLRILLGCGLRREEASTLTLRDIDFQNNALTIRRTKSGEYRIVPMDLSLAAILSQYCIALGLGSDPDTFIFPGTDFTNSLPAYCFRYHFNCILSIADITMENREMHERGPCLHCFRHTFAHRSFRKGIIEGWAVNDQIPWLSVYLGHKSLKETEKYLKFNSEMFAEEIDPFDLYSMDLYPEVNFDE